MTKTKTVNRETAWRAYGGRPPLEVMGLADLADRHGQRGAARLVGLSRPACGALIADTTFPRGPIGVDRDRAYAAIRAYLDTLYVECPLIGGRPLMRSGCLRHQVRTFHTPSMPFHFQAARTCPTCRHSAMGGKNDA